MSVLLTAWRLVRAQVTSRNPVMKRMFMWWIQCNHGDHALTPILRSAVVLALVSAAMPAAGAQGQASVDELLMRVGERVAEFYKRATNVICIETSTVQPVDSGNSPRGFARTVESELR